MVTAMAFGAEEWPCIKIPGLTSCNFTIIINFSSLLGVGRRLVVVLVSR